MVIHIAIDGIDGVGKTTQAIRLVKFFHKKNYKVAYLNQPHQKDIIYILQNRKLSNDQIALLMAVDRSITYYENNFKDFDIVVWDRSILSSYVYNTDEKVNKEFIKNINRYFPPMDLYIIITADKILAKQDYTNTDDIIHKYEKLVQGNDNIASVKYIPNNIDEVFENIVKKCFEKLPKCNWCGRIFTKSTKNKKYCSTKCRKYAREEQNRENNRNYYNRYKDTLTERQKGQLGSYGANLHSKPDTDFEKEKQKIKKGMKALKLKSNIP
jgi:thymidylate kinase